MINRRWIRQGKITATLVSKKEGYLIDTQSLNDFVQKKLESTTNSRTTFTKRELEQKYTEGFHAAKENQQFLISHAVKNREKELILKKLYESTITYSRSQLLHGFKNRKELAVTLKELGIFNITLTVLGPWVYDDQTRILLDSDLAPYPNRKLETRIKEWYVKTLYEFYEKNS